LLREDQPVVENLLAVRCQLIDALPDRKVRELFVKFASTYWPPPQEASVPYLQFFATESSQNFKIDKNLVGNSGRTILSGGID
jgi:hypothetical protein